MRRISAPEKGRIVRKVGSIGVALALIVAAVQMTSVSASAQAATISPSTSSVTASAASTASTAAAKAAKVALAPTPPMGFNDWNSFGCNVDEQLIKQTADLFVSSGLKAAGYQYVNIDDCWMQKTRSATGHLVPDPVKFPDGIKGTADYVHSLGLKLGIYESAGSETCAHYPGSYGHETTDATDFAAWGVDYLKYDNCGTTAANASTQAQYQARYQAMADALKATGRPIVYSLCEWGQQQVWTWGASMASLWRTTGDINDSWGSLKSIIAQNAPLAQYAHPGAWNDPDMLEVGNGGMTDTEYKTHFALWAEMSSPLLIGTDLRTASPETMAILTNKKLIAIDQDKLGVQGSVIAQGNGTMVFNKPLANGDRSVALYNSTDAATTISTTTAQIGLKRSGSYTMTDLWSNATTETAGTISASVPAHGTAIYRVKADADYTRYAPSTTLGLTSTSSYSGADVAIGAGDSATITSTLRDDGKAPLTDVRINAVTPAGWSITPATASVKQIRSGATSSKDWTLTAPASAATGSYPLTLTATYAYGNGKVVTATRSAVVQIVSTPPTGTTALSDLGWVSSTNGWGPVEKDTSNGETAAGDGKTISIRGTTYQKGLGANATSDIVYYLGGKCSSLTSNVGIDDEVAASGGNVIFQVFADDSKVADSGVLTNTSAVKSLTADVTGATWLRLHIDPNGDTNYDHADWAAPELTCAS